MNSKENRGDGRRVPRVEREIREVIGTYLLGGFRGELPGIVSVTRVIASKDLRNAKVLITLMEFGDAGDESKTKALRKAAVTELQSHAHQVQHEVNKKLRMKHCPKLTFLYDEGYEHAMKVENILRDLELKKKSESTTDASEDSGDQGSQSDENSES